jgi:threo-3-hydroxy-L-aspartate ammonia-lyase
MADDALTEDVMPRAAEPTALVSLGSIQAAAAALPGQFRYSPVVRWDDEAWLKLESIQPTGSFKIRGAWTKLSRLPPAVLARGVIAYSSGNHGIAVAHAARLCGATATVVVPGDTPGPKAGAIVLEGASLVPCAGGSEERRLLAEAIAADTGQVLVPPYNDADVIAGQGTIGVELAEQLPQLSAVIVPIGGGGLISGVAAAIKALRPSVRVIGVEPELASDAREALATGTPVQWAAEEVGQTIADAVRTQALGPLNFAHVISLVDEIVTVTDEEILAAAVTLLRTRHLVVEPAGAVALAAVRARIVPAAGTAALISGGNASAEILATMLAQAEELERSVLAGAGNRIGPAAAARNPEHDAH